MAKVPTLFASWTLAVSGPLRYWKIEKLAGVWTVATNPVIYINPGDVSAFYTLNAGKAIDGIADYNLALAHSADSTDNYYGNGSATPISNNITSAESSNYVAPMDGVCNTIEHGGFIYTLVYQPSTFSFQVLKSSTGVSPWTVLDSANALQLGANGSNFCIKGTKFVVQSFYTAQALFIGELDVSSATPTWNYVANGDYNITGAGTAGPSPVGAESAGASTGLQLFDDGSLGFFYRKVSAPNALYYRKFTPGGIGTLGTEVTIQSDATGTVSELTQLIVNPDSGQMYALTKYFDSFGSFLGWQYYTVAEDGTVGAVIQQFPGGTLSVFAAGMGHASIFDGKLYIPYIPGGAGVTDAYHLWEGNAGGTLTDTTLPVPSAETGNPPTAQVFSLDWFTPAIDIPISFNLKGGGVSGLLGVQDTPGPVPPGPVTNPTECINQE